MSALKDIEDMRSMALDPDQVRELVGGGGTCVLIWSHLLETRAESVVSFDWEKFGAALGATVAAGRGAESPVSEPEWGAKTWPST